MLEYLRRWLAPRPAVADLLESIRKDPWQWRFDHYHAVHRETRLSLWIANGVLFLEVDETSPVQVRLGPLDRWRVYRALDQARDIQLSTSLQDPNSGRSEPSPSSMSSTSSMRSNGSPVVPLRG